MARFQIFVIFILFCLYKTQGQVTVSERTCCSANLMDSGGRVVIDIKYGVNFPDLYTGIRVLMCATSPTYIQFWKQDQNNPSGFTLMWQMPYQSSYAGEFVFNFDSPINMDTHWKLGFFSPDADKHPVPYKYDRAAFTSQISMQTYPSNHTFNIGDDIQMDMLRFKRSFAVNVILCRRKDCPDQSQITLTPIIVQGPPGPPGPVGPACTAGPNFGLTGDQDAVRDINSIKSDTQKLYDIMAEMSNKINQLTQGNLVTGTCPVGFVSGTYGIGGCYYIHRSDKMSMLRAQMYCRRFKAHLVDVFSALEDAFLRNEITRIIAQSGDGPETFWTSGMYSTKSLQWVWYQENIFIPNTLIYQNFFSADARQAGGDKRCLALTVDDSTNTSWWSAQRCEDTNYFICKVSKKCL